MEKLSLLRAAMKRAGIACHIISSSDPHGSEYVPAAFKLREFVSGFSGSAGTLVVTMDEAFLWTDGRYFLQAEQELAGSGIALMRQDVPGVPSIIEYLKKNMAAGGRLGFDGRTVSARQGLKYAETLRGRQVEIDHGCDLAPDIWPQRPPLPAQPVWELGIDWSGQQSADKLAAVREQLAADGHGALILNSLDDIAWLFNIRGSDIPQNPVALAYAYVSPDKALLFARAGVVSAGLAASLLAAGIETRDYDGFYGWLSAWADAGGMGMPLDSVLLDSVLLDGDKCSYTIYKILSEKQKPQLGQSPTVAMKAVKNAVELKRLTETYKVDSATVIRFIKWLGEQEGPISETQAAAYMDELRRKSEGFIDLSFSTLAAYGANAAIVHYVPLAGSDAVMEKQGFFLIDSGGQYHGGTTDVTRTIAMGDITDDMRRHFGAVVRGMLALQNTVFLHGIPGRNLDAIARRPLWELLSDYKHGTGHGVGYMLHVHEGPQGIRTQYGQDQAEAPLVPGMLVSNEPGVYKAGEYGIRIENILLVKDVAANADGRFLGFSPLTLVPIDLTALDIGDFSPAERRQLNEYHALVYEEMAACLDAKEREWLKDATRAV